MKKGTVLHRQPAADAHPHAAEVAQPRTVKGFQAGFGCSDITPRPGVQMSGYGPYRNRQALAILAPLFARAALLDDGSSRSLLLGLELGGLPREFASQLRKLAAQEAGIPADRVFAWATHTHSSPTLGGMVGWGMADTLYKETLSGRVLKAVQMARDSLRPCRVQIGESACEGMAVNREIDKAQGFLPDFVLSERLRPDWRPPHPEETDPICRVLAFYDGNRLAGVFHHFACHPVIGGEKTFLIHGDYPGFASSRLETKYPGCIALYLPGAFGDINPSVCHVSETDMRRALPVLSGRYTHSIQKAIARSQPLADAITLQDIRQDRVFPRLPWGEKAIRKKILSLERWIHAHGERDDPAYGVPPLQTLGMNMARLEGLRQLLSQCQDGKPPNPPVNIHLLRIGPLHLLGIGLEIYHRLGQQLGRALGTTPQQPVWTVSLVGGQGYALDARALWKTGYSGEFIPLILGEVPHRALHLHLVKACRELGTGTVLDS